jgi:L-threonylcarbamoyladenylate synthase
MRLFQLTPKNHSQVITQALQVLNRGGLIIYPTETCYGLGVDATNPEAVSKLLQFKTRREGKAVSIAVADQAMAQQYVILNSTALNLYRHLLPGPLTVISRLKSSSRHSERSPSSVLSHKRHTKNLYKSNHIALGLASENHTLGVRVPDYPFVLKLIQKFGRPITATSANVSYRPAPYSLTQWRKTTPKKSRDLVDLFLDAGRLPRRPSSTVIDTTADELTVLRQGTIKISQPTETVTTHSESQTRDLAARLVQQHLRTLSKSGLVIALQGELGAGKTVFAQGAAQALGIHDQIKSPTFTLVHEYSIPSSFFTEPFGTPPRFFTERSRSAERRKRPQASAKSMLSLSKHSANHHFPPTFYHIDAWRLEKPQELLGLGFEKMLKPGNLIIIEWAEKVAELLNNLVSTETRLHLVPSQNMINHVPTGKPAILWIAIDVLNPTARRWQIAGT